MTTETAKQLKALGIDPDNASQGVTYSKTGITYAVKEFFSEARGIKMFRVFADGKLKLLAQEQIIAIFG